MMHLCGVDVAPGGALQVLSGLVSCCEGAAMRGPEACTCWTTVFDKEQIPARREFTEKDLHTRNTMCEDCAYKPGSPERTGDDRYVEPPTDPSLTFWCHQGIRKPVEFRHPLGIVVKAATDGYQPLQVVVAGQGVPLRADGTPADRCAGWAAHRRMDSDVVANLAREMAGE